VSASRFLEVLLEGVHLDRGGHSVLRDIHWHIRPGERWVVLGGNGAGKTQLLKLLAGEVWPAPQPRGLRRYLYRGEHYDTPLTVKDEVAYVGPERQDRYERYDHDFTALAVVGTGLYRTDIPLDALTVADKRMARAQLRTVRIARLAGRRLLSLSYGERRLVLLARALASRPGLLLLDEAANGLDVPNRRRLEAWLDGTRRSRLPWVYTTHRAEDVPASANRLLLLEGGQVRYAGVLDRRHLQDLLPVAVRRPATVARRPAPAARNAAPLVELQAADVFHEAVPLLRGVDLAVRAGECWVVHGANGSGKTTLLRTLYGDHAVARPGRVLRLGSARLPLAEFRRRCGFVAPHLHGQHLQNEPVLDTVVSGLHSSIGLNDAATLAEKQRARTLLRELGLASLAGRTLRETSYGQLRRVLFARALIRQPSLLLLDEPFAGVDAVTRRRLLEALESRVMGGMAMVMASHHRSEWPAVTTHEIELRRGRVVYAGVVRR
jgi:molybdate transport system ATP-binding protein